MLALKVNYKVNYVENWLKKVSIYEKKSLNNLDKKQEHFIIFIKSSYLLFTIESKNKQFQRKKEGGIKRNVILNLVLQYVVMDCGIKPNKY